MVRSWLGRAAFLLALVSAPACARTDTAPRRNLVLISLDTCRADRLGCYGAERPLTPNLDRLATEAVRFEDCLAQSCVTAPSHMSLFTGQYVTRHGLQENGAARVPHATLASALREAGYRTAAFTGHGSLQAQYGHATGFELFESHVDEASDRHTRNLDEVVPRAIRWLDEAGREPFFLFVHGYDPHCPYWPPEPVREEYGGWYDGPLDLSHECSPPKFKNLMREGVLDEEGLRYLRDMYDGEIAVADRRIGEFLEALRERGLDERSVVVFTSDHGESLGTGRRVGHGALWPEVLRVPLLVRFPGGRWAGPRAEPVELVDLAPTLLGALGVEGPPGVQGRDLSAWIRGDVPAPARELRLAHAQQATTVFFGKRWRILFNTEGARVTSRGIFDLEADPLGTRNLIEDLEHEARFEDLYARYVLWDDEQEEGDRLYGGREMQVMDAAGTRSMLEALGYAGEGE